jgi:thioredoxin 1
MKDTTRNYLVLGLIIVAGVAMMMFNRVRVSHLAAQLNDDSIVGNGKPVLLQLGAHWCGPCRRQLPIMVALGNEQKAFLTAFLDVDALPDKAPRYEFDSIPTLIFFDADGRELYRYVGFHSKADILAQWEKLGIYAGHD